MYSTWNRLDQSWPRKGQGELRSNSEQVWLIILRRV